MVKIGAGHIQVSDKKLSQKVLEMKCENRLISKIYKTIIVRSSIIYAIFFLSSKIYISK